MTSWHVLEQTAWRQLDAQKQDSATTTVDGYFA
jgi:hypothetical protein